MACRLLASTGAQPLTYSSTAASPEFSKPSIWVWTIAAPAARQARASSAISSADLGVLGLRALEVVPFRAASIISGVMALPTSASGAVARAVGRGPGDRVERWSRAPHDRSPGPI